MPLRWHTSLEDRRGPVIHFSEFANLRYLAVPFKAVLCHDFIAGAPGDEEQLLPKILVELVIIDAFLKELHHQLVPFVSLRVQFKASYASLKRIYIHAVYYLNDFVALRTSGIVRAPSSFAPNICQSVVSLLYTSTQNSIDMYNRQILCHLSLLLHEF
ncbi:hypothetical protein BDV96DRAFT_260015 [Lophiotrema nucula]|uniref:Uncharacterized protein n=1 Tax=Lophiotrema nucula TaxID=690887 RepID=A0A6A5YPY7_9PLEO|nr:hypothetical protein BDV96DRAFT_260015 [Lophiotrema nucula]